MRRPIILLSLLFLGILVLMAAKNSLTAPPPLRSHGTEGQFDAVRAQSRLAFILGDQRPHPADTTADDGVRARLIDHLRSLGLQPIIRDQITCNGLEKQRGVSCARVRNVIALLGPATGKAILLNAHYDSTPVGPGAADDGIGVATLLEVASILRGQPLKRPVILLFNEGEELGIIGARAFLSDPLSKNVGSLINLEARGVQGRANMFETNRPNAEAVAIYAAAVDAPAANSLSTDVYRLLPNYTDVNSFAERGWLTFNLAPTGNETRYHSPGDDVAALDPATLQHMGDQTLALTKALLGNAPQASSGDRIFMDVAGRLLVSLPLFAGVILLVGLLIGWAILALQRGHLLRCTAVIVGTLTGSAALSWLALSLIGAVRQGMFWRAEPVWTCFAAYASAILVAAVLLSTLGRNADRRQLRASFWLALAIVGAIIGLMAPGGIVFFLFPPLVALIGALSSRWWKPAEQAAAVLAIVILYATWGAMLGSLEEVLNQGPMWIFAPLGALVILPILIEAKPLLEATRPRSSAMVAGLLAVLGWAASAAALAYSADRQQRFVIQHVTDTSTRKSWWSVLNDSAPLPDAFRTAGTWNRGKLAFSERSRWIARSGAEPAIEAPVLQLVSQVRNGTDRTVNVRLNANGNERVELVAPDDSKIRSAGLDGSVRLIDQNADGKFYVDCFGRSCDGATFQFTIGQLKPIEILLVGGRAGLPSAAAPLLAARPKLARPQYARDETIAFSRVRL